MDNLKLNDTICFYRKKHGLTQEDLAQRLGVTNQSVSKWESSQCCPDISLIPKLADIFEISIDELFGKEHRPYMTRMVTDDAIFSEAVKIVNESGKISASLLQRKLNIGYKEAVDLIDLIKDEVIDKEDSSSQFSWPDDDTYRVIVTKGKKVMAVDEITKTINIDFPKNCNETAREYFKVEVFGNICCDSNINGDVIAHGKIECNQINGDVKNCEGDIECQGDINGSANANGSISCGKSISGGVQCGNSVACGQSINGAINCGDNVACGISITGDINCGGNIECKKIEGDVECQGNIIYK